LSSFTLRKLDADTLGQLGSWTSQRTFLGTPENDRLVENSEIFLLGGESLRKAQNLLSWC